MKTTTPDRSTPAARSFVSRCALAVLLLVSCCQAQTPLGHGYVRDGEHIHYEGGGSTDENGGTLIDAPSRDVIDGFQAALVRKVLPCTDLDAESFVPLSEEYSRDQNRVYYKWISPGRFLVVELPDADPGSFQALSSAYAKDANTVWYLDRPIARSDPASFVVIENRTGKDRNSVYVSGRRVRHLHAATYRHLASGYNADKNGVYWGVEPVRGADIATFEVLGDSFIAKDADTVYRSGEAIEGFDAPTTKLLLHDPYGYQILSDRNGVYLNRLKFLHADPDDFVVRDNRSAVGAGFLFVVDTYHSTPITVFRENGGLVVETILYDRATSRPLATARADLTERGMENTRLSPPPGAATPAPVPAWLLQVFEREDLAATLREKAELYLPE